MYKKIFFASLIFVMILSISVLAIASSCSGGGGSAKAASSVQQDVDRASEAAGDSPGEVDTSNDSGEGADAAWMSGAELD